jgi:hypothetical protein
LAVFLLTLFIFEMFSCFVGVLFAASLSNLYRSIPLNEVNQFKHEVVQQLGETLSDDQKRWLTEIFEGEPITTLTLVMLGSLDLALIIALIGALNRGGSAVIKHYGVRLVLCGKSFSPLNLVAFLDHCDKLILLKKVGGGYIFIHRMLLDYFADLPTIETSSESKRT